MKRFFPWLAALVAYLIPLVVGEWMAWPFVPNRMDLVAPLQSGWSPCQETGRVGTQHQWRVRSGQEGVEHALLVQRPHQVPFNVIVNGHRVGQRSGTFGIPEGHLWSPQLYRIGAENLSPGTNTICLEGVRQEDAPRAYVGPYAVLQPWSAALNGFDIRVAGAAFLGFPFLILVTWILTSANDRRQRLYWWTMAQLGTACAFAGLYSNAGLWFEVQQNWPGALWGTLLVAFFWATFQVVANIFDIHRENKVYVWFKNPSVFGAAWVLMAFLTFLFADRAIFFIASASGWAVLSVSASLWLLKQNLHKRMASVRVLGVGLVLILFEIVIHFVALHQNWAQPNLLVFGVVSLAIATAGVVYVEFVNLSFAIERLSGSLADQNTQLKAAFEKASYSLQQKNEFLANVSHELRTPLNTLINVPLALSEQSFVEKSPTEHEFVGDPQVAFRHLQASRNSAAHLLSIINAVLDFSRLEANKEILHCQWILPTAVLERAWDEEKANAIGKNVDLELTVAQSAIQLWADPTKATQAVRQVLKNAIHFSPPQSQVRCRVFKTETTIAISISDQGPGIPLELQAAIFETFLQVDGSHVRSKGGLGLGLAITKAIVGLHGGRVELQSHPRQGSTFTLHWPLHPPAESNSIEPPSGSPLTMKA